MANLKIDDILNHNGIATAEDLLTIDYITETGKGTFKIWMPAKFPTTAHNMKVVIDMLNRAGDPEEAARPLYDYLKKCSDFLTDLRNRTEGITDQDKKDRAQLLTAIKKYNANIEALCKYYDFEAVTTEVVKMQKIEVIADRLENGQRKAVNKTGYRFKKAGYTWHVYKENKTVFVIVPCCGLSIATYTGDVRTAPEYITEHIVNLMNNGTERLKAAHAHFMDLVKESENLILNDDIKVPEAIQDTTPAPTEEVTPAPAAVPETDQATVAQTAETEPKTDRTTPPRPVYIAIVYYGVVTGSPDAQKAPPERARAPHTGILCNQGIINYIRSKAPYIAPYKAPPRHNTPLAHRARIRYTSAPPGFLHGSKHDTATATPLYHDTS